MRDAPRRERPRRRLSDRPGEPEPAGFSTVGVGVGAGAVPEPEPFDHVGLWTVGVSVDVATGFFSCFAGGNRSCQPMKIAPAITTNRTMRLP